MSHSVSLRSCNMHAPGHRYQQSGSKPLRCFFLFKYLFIFMCTSICVHVYVFTPHVYPVFTEHRRGCRSSGTRVTDGCEPECGCWDPSLEPSQMQSAALISRAILSSLRVLFYPLTVCIYQAAFSALA